MSKICDVFFSDKGGVAKTEMALNTILNAQQSGVYPVVIEVDPNPRLSGILGSDKVSISMKTSPNVRQQLTDRAAVREYFHPVFGAMTEGHSVADFGAGVPEVLFDHLGEDPDLVDMVREEGVRWRWISPCVPENSSVRASYTALTKAVNACGGTEHGDEYFLILNDLTGNGYGFENFKTLAIWKELEELKRQVGLKIIEIPHAECRLMTMAQTHAKSAAEMQCAAEDLLDLLKSGEAVTMPLHKAMYKVLGLGELSTDFQRKARVSNERKVLAKWLEVVGERLKPVSVFES